MRYLVFIIALFAALQTNAQNNIVYGAGINYTNGAPTFTPPVRTSRVAIDTVTGKWYHFNTPGGWQLIGNTIEEIAGCTAPAYTPTKGDSKVVINNCSPQPELYFYNGSAWVLVGGGSVYAGEGIRIENDTIILDSLNFLDFRTGSALDGDVGRVQWNDTDGTLDLNLKGGNVTLQIGQEEVSFVKNADNAGLIEGRAVYIVGADGANKTVRYAKADSDLTSATTFGLMTESATGGNKAFCTTFGLVRNLNTLNLTEGGIVWLSADTAGTLTAVRPTAPDHGVMVGFCIRKHATNGVIFVEIQNGYELDELHNVHVPSPSDNQALVWIAANNRWEARTVDNDPSDDVTGSGANGQVTFWTGLKTQGGDNGLFWDNSNKRLGVGTSTPSNRLHINGPSSRFENSSGTFELDIVGGGTTSRLASTSTGLALGTLSNNALVFWMNATERMRINSTTGHLGIATTAPAARLHVVGSGTSSSTWTAQFHNSAGNNNALMIRDDGNVGIGTNNPSSRLQINGSGNTSASTALTVQNSDGVNLLRVRNDLNTSINYLRLGNSFGTSPYIFPFSTNSGVPDPDGTNLSFYNYTGSGSAAGGAFVFAGSNFTQTSGAHIYFRFISNFTPSSGTATFDAFNIRPGITQTGGASGITRGLHVNPGLTSAADWRSIEWSNNTGWGIYGNGSAKSYFAGNVAIGTTTQNASSAFEVASTTQGILFPRMTTTQRNAITTPADGLVIYNTTDNKLQVRAGGAWVDLH